MPKTRATVRQILREPSFTNQPRRRKNARMVEKLDQFEVLKEVSLLIDSLEPGERRQVMASLAERNGMKLVERNQRRP